MKQESAIRSIRDAISLRELLRATKVPSATLILDKLSPQDMVLSVNVVERILADGGMLNVLGLKADQSYSYTGSRAKIWKFLNYVARSDNFEVVQQSSMGDRISVSARVKRAYAAPRSMCVGYITSGGADELIVLKENFSRWRLQSYPTLEVKFSIAIDSEAINGDWRDFCQEFGIWLIPCDGVRLPGGRVLTAQKKHMIMAACPAELYVLCHARIQPVKIGERDLLDGLISPYASPRVTFDGHPYLDLIAVPSLEVLGQHSAPPLFSGYHMPHWMRTTRNRYLYIDGGINIVDARYTGRDIYDIDFAWGEAEDIEVAKRLYNSGISASLVAGVEVKSLTNKRKSLDKLRYHARRALSL